MTKRGPNREWKPGVRLADSVITKQALVVALGTIAAGLLGTALCAAESAGGNADEQTTSQELKALEDPTILLRRIWLETEWNKYRDGHNGVEETLGGLWAWRVSDNQDWAVRRRWVRRFLARARTGWTSAWASPWAARLKSRSLSRRRSSCSVKSSARRRWACNSGLARW